MFFIVLISAGVLLVSTYINSLGTVTVVTGI